MVLAEEVASIEDIDEAKSREDGKHILSLFADLCREAGGKVINPHTGESVEGGKSEIGCASDRREIGIQVNEFKDNIRIDAHLETGKYGAPTKSTVGEVKEIKVSKDMAHRDVISIDGENNWMEVTMPEHEG